MDTDYMKIFVEICRNDYNVSKTSQIVNISQPALSKMINGMENEFGTEIFLRNKGRFVGLTESGKIIFDHFEEILTTYSNLKKEIKNKKDKSPCNIKIGASPKIIDVLIGKNIYQLYEDENMIVEFVDHSIDTLTKKFFNNELDILILLSCNDIQNSLYYSERIASSEYVAIMSKHHMLAKKDNLSWSDLKYAKIALSPKGNQTHDFVTEKLSYQRIFPESIYCISSYKLLLDLPLKNNIVTILPKIFYENYATNDELITKSFKKVEYWNVDMFMLKEEKREDSSIYRLFKKIVQVNQCNN